MGEHYEGTLNLTGHGNEPAEDEDTPLGRHAYGAYAAAVGDWSKLPAWDDVEPDIRGAWVMAARAVKNTLLS